jgi:hypothetical protein
MRQAPELAFESLERRPAPIRVLNRERKFMAGEAPAIVQHRSDANAAWPKRDKSMDGT